MSLGVLQTIDRFLLSYYIPPLKFKPYSRISTQVAMCVQDHLSCISMIKRGIQELSLFCLAGGPCKLYSLREFSGYAHWFSVKS